MRLSNVNKPFFFAFLSRGIFLILSIFDGRDLFRHRWFFLFLFLLFASCGLLQDLKVRVWVNLLHLFLRDGQRTSEEGGPCWNFERFVKLNRHAESKEEQVCVGILRSKCLMGHFETWRSFHCPIYPSHLRHNGKRQGDDSQILKLDLLVVSKLNFLLIIEELPFSDRH